MRRLLAASLIGAALSGGCRMCQGPDDYTGPVIRDGLPTLGFCERHNSILSGGTFSTRAVPGAADESSWDEAEGDAGAAGIHFDEPAIIIEQTEPAAPDSAPRLDLPPDDSPRQPQPEAQPRVVPPPQRLVTPPRTAAGWRGVKK